MPGYDVKVSEVHGMSQRGGSVVTYVRFGDKVYSPIIDKGEADFIVSFELLEAARWIAYLKPDRPGGDQYPADGADARDRWAGAISGKPGGEDAGQGDSGGCYGLSGAGGGSWVLPRR